MTAPTPGTSAPQHGDPPPRLPDDIVPTSVLRSDLSRYSLPSGRALTTSEAGTITGARRAQVITIAGMPRSGKTTLIAALYGHFLRDGVFAKYTVKSSRTLWEFEAISFLARSESGRTKADTQRTPEAESRFLHLQLASSDSREIDILFSDLWGEAFRQMRIDRPFAKSLSVIARADHFALLIDGSHLADAGLRHSAVNDAYQILDRTLEVGHLDSDSNVDLVITKADRMNAIMGEESARDRQQRTFDEFAPLLQRCGDVRHWSLAARNDDGDLEKDPAALAAMFDRWVTQVRRPASATRYSTPQTSKDAYLSFGS